MIPGHSEYLWTSALHLFPPSRLPLGTSSLGPCSLLSSSPSLRPAMLLLLASCIFLPLLLMQVTEQQPSSDVSASSDQDHKGSPCSAKHTGGKQLAAVQSANADAFSTESYIGGLFSPSSSVPPEESDVVLGSDAAACAGGWRANFGGDAARGPPPTPAGESLPVSASDCPSADGSSGTFEQMRPVMEALQAAETASMTAAGGGPPSASSKMATENRGHPQLQVGPSPSPAALDGTVVCDSAAKAGTTTLTHSDDASTNLLLHRQMESLRGELAAAGGSQQWEVHGELGKGAFGVVYKVGSPSARLLGL